ncbi:MAG TPA: DUF692 family protein [Polyangia bacterium]|nr:DUF692 family protein [Polyangia bacterium]
MIPVGFTLQPDPEFLERCERIIRRANYWEVAPETLWRRRGEGRLEPNGFHRGFLRLARRGHFFVAHGVGLSLGTVDAGDARRRRSWLRRVRADHETFGFRWYTDHLGASSVDGMAMTLPLPLPMTVEASRAVRRRLAQMQRVVGDVGVENNVAYFVVGDPLDEPRFLMDCVRARGCHLLLDLHNVYTMATNFGFDPADYLRRLDLAKVIEIHVSGGGESSPAWLPSGRVLRLDSHDGAVPELVWRMLEAVAPRCPNLRGVTLERMEGTVGDGDELALAGEFERLRAIVQRTRWAPARRSGLRAERALVPA